ncbi:hypothetical protein WQ54_12715 [Bacillus sp. SA1-12]|uniref:hypothetical protein n=1 Tax=Bacillus sp. SA1-12 TaxID=1455638 RepID=UPI000625D13A|nr:hypothetical protein [Bacillus sp. SA1-12]KKI91826.1 hypothetical protein WQ54_12715 [Bacillus sp. SA1-12]
MINILQMINDNKVSEDIAYDILDEVMEKFQEGKLSKQPKDELNMDNYEWTAFCHGASLGVLARWRKEGWQEQCSHCRRKINYKKYGWTIRDDKLIGLNCCDGL